MEEFFTRVIENIVGRVSGPMHLRIIFQPIMATIFACIGAWGDVKKDAPMYFWSVFSGKSTWKETRHSAWKGAGRVFLMAVVLDLIYEIVVLKSFYPGETLIVASLLVFVPYLLLRGPVSSIFRMFFKNKSK